METPDSDRVPARVLMRLEDLRTGDIFISAYRKQVDGIIRCCFGGRRIGRDVRRTIGAHAKILTGWLLFATFVSSLERGCSRSF
jgi:hypothetical protein